MQFLNGLKPQFDLTYNDVFMVPNETNSMSRMDVDLTSNDGLDLSMPIVVSNMTAVAGKRMAETVARRGGLVVLPQDFPLDELRNTIGYIKSANTVFETPVSLSPSNTAQEALNLIDKRAHGAVIVIDKDKKPQGIFTKADAANRDLFSSLGDLMSANLVSFDHQQSLKDMFNELDEAHVRVAPVTKSGKLIGAITKKGAIRSMIYKPAVDKKGRLKVAVAVGINGDVAKKVAELVALGVDVIVLDTAHGYQTNMINAINAAQPELKGTPLVAGNVASAEATKALIDAGADIVKVGIGPGAMCTTRVMTGVGRPQFSAVLECAEEAKKHGKHVWADGGIRYPRDVALALAAGASAAMFASWFAGTYESASDIEVDSDGRKYKVNFGMASKRAVTDRNRAQTPYDRRLKQYFEEGISESKAYLNPHKPGVEDIIDQIAAGVRSSMTYAGAANLKEFQNKAIVGIQSTSGYMEGHAMQIWDRD